MSGTAAIAQARHARRALELLEIARRVRPYSPPEDLVALDLARSVLTRYLEATQAIIAHATAPWFDAPRS